jgi:hypothetical protein
MVNLIRKYQQPVLIGITILVIVTFIWFWNGSQAGRAGLAGANKVATIYGQSITDTDVKRLEGKFEISRALGLTELLQSLAGTAQNQQEAVNNFITNSYVFDHEADALQVFPTDQEVQDELTKVPGFQTDGRFDANKLTDFVQNKLPSLGFADSVIDELVRDQVRVRKVVALIGATVEMTPSELKNQFEIENETMAISVVRLSTSDVEKGIAVSDADAKKVYDQHKESYRSEEQRKVSVASFELTDAQKELKGKERTDALQKVGNDAWTFALAVVDKGSDFAAQAKKAGVPLGESAFFTASQPDPALTKITELAANTFKLSPEYPSSDVLEGKNGYYVLHLVASVPSAQLSFDQAKGKVVAQIQKERAAQLMQTTAVDARNRIVAAVKAGKSFADAAKAAGMTAESLQPFTLTEASKMDVPDFQSIIQSAIALGSGEFSEFVPTESGGLLVYMESRKAPDKSTAALGEVLVESQYARQKQVGAFLEWMRLRKDAARLQIVQRT